MEINIEAMMKSKSDLKDLVEFIAQIEREYRTGNGVSEELIQAKEKLEEKTLQLILLCVTFSTPAEERSKATELLNIANATIESINDFLSGSVAYRKYCDSCLQRKD